MPKIAIFSIISGFKNGLDLDNNADLWASMGKTCKKIVVYPKSPQFSQKLSASNARMFATFLSLARDHDTARLVLI